MRPGRWDDESVEYAKRRDELHRAEIELRDQRERVAALRRELPADTVIDDQVFEAIRDGHRAPVNLSELFEDPSKPLVLMHVMFGKAQKNPCPMCTLWADGYDGAIPHLKQRLNFAVLVAGDVEEFAAFAAGRGWRHIPIVSAADSDLKLRLGFETPSGDQLPGVSVFTRRAEGTLIHGVSQCAILGEAGGRGLGRLSPVWNFFDLTPEGRGDWMPGLSYAPDLSPGERGLPGRTS